jgi:hypothetical protein
MSEAELLSLEEIVSRFQEFNRLRQELQTRLLALTSGMRANGWNPYLPEESDLRGTFMYFMEVLAPTLTPTTERWIKSASETGNGDTLQTEKPHKQRRDGHDRGRFAK